MRSWVPVPDGSDFPLENLPYGVFAPPGGAPRAGVAIGTQILDLGRLARAGLLDGTLHDPVGTFTTGSLNGFLALGRPVWRSVRERLQALLRDENSEIRDRAGFAGDVLVAQEDARMQLPVAIGDYADFYSSIEHATNVGKLFRPGADPLLPNYRWMPIGYHGRSSTVVVDGSEIVRPQGQRKRPDEDVPTFGPSRQLDFELEIGFITGPPNDDGAPIPTSRAADHIFGLVLLNDWSARDIQAWEYQPLGPFLSKSFATSISPWVVTLDALAPYRAKNRTQEPPPLPHLRVDEHWALDIDLDVALQTLLMRRSGLQPLGISSVNFAAMYWNMPQQLAHLTGNGARIRPGDLYGSGTVSGPEPGTYGSLLELTRRGTQPLAIPGGETRGFLEDGDSVIMRGAAFHPGRPRIGFGEVRGTVAPASRLI